MNPFKFGTIVKDAFFTDRVEELRQVVQMLDSENHLVLISPRRFGKSSLIDKALTAIGRPSIVITEHVVSFAIRQQVQEHDLDYERLWLTLKRTDRQVLTSLANNQNPLSNRKVATSTTFSALKRLVRQGYLIKTDNYELEDPFFREWIVKDN